jgi:protein gp37
MSKRTAVSWTHHTFNPWWGCTKVSAGCQHCYAEAFAKRTGHAVWGAGAKRRFFGDKHWNEPIAWDNAAFQHGRRRVFCASMADVFEDGSGLGSQRARLFALIEKTPNLDWLLLTKRPENIAAMVPLRWLDEPRRNVWFGTSVEDQAAAEERIHHLIGVPAARRFLSCEPLLGPVDLDPWIALYDRRLTHIDGRYDEGAHESANALGEFARPEAWALHWVIVGGESGPGFRAMELDWARSLRDQCRAAGAAFFFKQQSAAKAGQGAELDGEVIQELPR